VGRLGCMDGCTGALPWRRRGLAATGGVAGCCRYGGAAGVMHDSDVGRTELVDVLTQMHMATLEETALFVLASGSTDLLPVGPVTRYGHSMAMPIRTRCSRPAVRTRSGKQTGESTQ
jgi:hypothetical protein